MLALARAFATDPKLLLLDELSMGLAPIVVGAALRQGPRAGGEAGLSILLVEQFARTALPIADSAAVVLQGVIAHRGSPAEMEEALSDQLPRRPDGRRGKPGGGATMPTARRRVAGVEEAPGRPR